MQDMNACNVPNRTIFLHDNLEVLQGLNDSCIDLIYLDPPFNKNKVFSAPIGSSAEGAEFSDIFREEDVKTEWLKTIESEQIELYQYLNGIKGVGKPYNFAYLAYMAVRLIECHRVLKTTGSLYLHCDPTMSHYLKSTLDCIFGEENFRNEIVWRRVLGGKSDATQYGRQSDRLLYYSKSANFTFEAPTSSEHNEKTIKAWYSKHDTKGQYQSRPLTAHGTTKGDSGQAWRGKNPTGHWVVPKLLVQRYEDETGKSLIGTVRERLDILADAGYIEFSSNGKPSWRKYLTEANLPRIHDLWVDDEVNPISRTSKERTGYPTQKPLALLQRVIKASSKAGDIVLDPFCGCATTCVAAEDTQRQWIGIDVSVKAYDLVKERLEKEVVHPDALPTYRNEIHLQLKPPSMSVASSRNVRYVYIISHRKYEGDYKVGIAKDVDARLKSFQIADPERGYRLEFKHETPLFYETEAYIHKIFENRYEWVTADLDDIKQEILNYAGD